MTLIIWKDGIIAADRCVTSGDTCREARKLVRCGNSVLAFAGPCDFGEAMLGWALDGFQQTGFPTTQSYNEYATLVRARPVGLGPQVSLYYQTPYPVVQADLGAVGVGAEFALGAMRYGASAEAAMRLALEWVRGLKFGYDVETFA